MKTKHLIIACMSALTLGACSSNDDMPEVNNNGGGTNTVQTGNVEMVVPVGNRSVRIDYMTAAGVKSLTAGINPEAKIVPGRSISPITNASLEVVSPVNTYINVYDEDGNLLIQNKFIPATANAVATQSTQGSVLVMPEDAVSEYVTADGPYTSYHSSGVVMFDDSWPRGNTGDGDFNDVVIDYDIEARTVDLNAVPDEAYREQVKVVMHVRAIGGGAPSKVGLELERLLSEYIDSYECTLTLGNWNTDVPSKGLTASVDASGVRPIIYINNIGWLIQSGPKNTYYINSKTGESQPINTSTIDPAYEDVPGISQFYNVKRGYTNVGGDLFTVTVVFNGKPRSAFASQADYEARRMHFIETVMETESQNFFIKTTEVSGAYEIHLKGYLPTPDYAARYTSDSASGVAKDDKTSYCGLDGSVWGFKVPVMTRHAWEKEPFNKAYPEFKAWQTSGGTANADWYKHPDLTRITCWW